MTIPKAGAIERPLLTAIRDGNPRKLRDVISELASHFDLTAEDLAVRHATGALKFENLARWARQRLKDDGKLLAPEWGMVQITKKGLAALNAEGLFIEPAQELSSSSGPIPEELLDNAIGQLDRRLCTVVLDKVREVTPRQFERLVVDLLLAMGYGFDRLLSGHVTAYSGDGGIDGLIHEDKLGLSTIYVQAKLYRNQNVQRPEVEQFVGALTGAGATKGVFLTSAGFSLGAKTYALSLRTQKVVLIDGERLARLMVDHDIGVSSAKKILVKQLDSDYFEASEL